MMYKTIVIDYAPKAKKMAAAIEQTANEKAQAGWELVTFSVTNSAKAILVFRTPDAALPEQTPAAQLPQDRSFLRICFAAEAALPVSSGAGFPDG